MVWQATSQYLKRLPLRLVLVVPFVLQICATVGLVGYLSYRTGQEAVQDLADQLMTEIGDRVEGDLRHRLKEPHQINQTNAQHIRLHLRDPDFYSRLEQKFLYQSQLYQSVTFIYFGTPEGGIILSGQGDDGQSIIRVTENFVSGPYYKYSVDSEGDRQDLLETTTYDARTRGWFQKAKANQKAVWSDIYPFVSTQSLGLTASLPIYDRQGDFQGVLGVDVSLSNISQFLQQLNIGQSGQIFIMERDGALVASSNQDQQLFIQESKEQIFVDKSQDQIVKDTAVFLKNKFGNFEDIKNTDKIEFDLQGETNFLQVFSLQDDHGLDWLIVIVVPESDFMDRIHANTKNTIILCAIALIVAVIIGILTARWVTYPILTLNRSAQDLAAGSWNSPELPDRSDELGQLAVSFHSMAEQLIKTFSILDQSNKDLEQRVAERTASLAAAEAELRGLFEAMTELILVFNRQGEYEKIISGSEELLVHNKENLLNHNIREFMEPELADWHLETIAYVLEVGQTERVEYQMDIQGKKHWFAANVSPISDRSVIWVVRDITPQKEARIALENALALQKAVLESIADGIIAVDQSERIIAYNNQFIKMWKVPPEILASQDVEQQRHFLAQQVEDPIAFLKRQQEMVNSLDAEGVGIIPFKDGRVFEQFSRPQKVGDQIMGRVWGFRDITERKQAEEALRQEKERSEKLLLNILPEAIADQLKHSQSSLAEDFESVTILFADIVGFTPLAAQVQPIQLVDMLNQVFSTFDQLTETYGLEKIKTIGDAYMVAGGLPDPMPNHLDIMARMALSMQAYMGQFKTPMGDNFQIRIGIHMGSVIAGVIGKKKFIYDLWGDTVNVASRMESSGEPGKIQVTETVYEALKEQYILEKRGKIFVKGKGEMDTYWLVSHKSTFP
ncbi:adenylate/guanylate cyclase domain-containing protein [Roseofilum capinflatum]|uniref:Adenylate/guanylate cyclase domain-containing protein n=1 Tax=Roseofilum capinflatum BLCC-M114 TaxID=3022440 RepID=A0ABT7B4J7_9CYAN|nr:adenylate/guanylate cyclase domain-containing protein [Roseofilum capinflatum]MDJ1174065.1 adenylate/guanylate cyclase domain-containing protein [Roseofilum capinflatum BLCC-M114]